MAGGARPAHNRMPRPKTCCHVVNQMHAVRTSRSTIAAKSAVLAGWEQDSKAADPEAGNMVRIDRKSPKTQVTRGRALSDLGTHTPRQSHGERKARKDGPAHDGKGMRTISVREEPREDEGIRRNGDAFDSLGLWEEQAVEGLAHHTLDRRKGAMQRSLAGSREEAADNLDLDPGSASQVAAHAPRRWLVEGVGWDTALDHRRAAESGRCFSGADTQYERARRPRHVLRQA